MTRNALLSLLVGLLVACAHSEYDARHNPGDAEAFSSLVRLDVQPSDELRVSEGLLPQSFTVEPDGGEAELQLTRPVTVSGRVHAWLTSPMALGADLPGVEVDLEGATATLRKPGTIQSANQVTDEEGRFEIRVVPDPAYHFSLRPSDPRIPPLSMPFPVGDDTELDLELDEGVALWGRVYDPNGQGLPGVPVYAKDGWGVTTAKDVTDSEGRYLLRVAEGDWWLVATGRPNGRDPIVKDGPLSVREDGLRADLHYGGLDLVTVSGQVTTPGGDGVDGVTVRFTAVELQGYDDAELTMEVRTNRNGLFDTRVLAGTWHAELLPDDHHTLSPVSVGEVELTAEITELGVFPLPPMVPLWGRVLDPAGEPVSGALLTFTEVGFGGRSWSTTSSGGDEAGRFALQASQVPLQITLTPPGDRSDLAMTRRIYQPQPSEPAVLGFEMGERIEGRVRYRDANDRLQPAAFTVIHARDTAGNLLGMALTDEDGTYRLQVAPLP